MVLLSLFYFIFVIMVLTLIVRIFVSYLCWGQQRSSQRLNDRQNNAFTTADETASDNRFNDIFFIEPNSPEAARIRAQLEKDDKELPSYDEVMRMTNLSTPTAAPVPTATVDNFLPTMPSALTMGASSSSVNTTDTTISLPAYREAETNGRPLTPPPYTPAPIGVSVVLPITAPLHSQ